MALPQALILSLSKGEGLATAPALGLVLRQAQDEACLFAPTRYSLFTTHYSLLAIHHFTTSPFHPLSYPRPLHLPHTPGTDCHKAVCTRACGKSCPGLSGVAPAEAETVRRQVGPQG